MSSVYKPKYTAAIPENAERCKLHGYPAARYVDGKGKKQVRPIKQTAKGERMVCQQSTWWMKYRLPDGTIRREKGFKDKLATEQEAARLEKEAQQAAAGVLIVDSKQLTAPLPDHIAAYVADLERAGRSGKHYELVKTRLGNITNGCGWDTLRHISPDSMSRYLASLKRDGLAAKTQNEYLAVAKSFCNWCVSNSRLAGNPLASVSKIEHVEKVYERRALTIEESRRLLEHAGPRRLIYLFALNTGLRRSEINQLQWGDVRIGPDEKTPYIALRASTTKARRADTLPLRDDIADELRAIMPTDAKPTDKVFGSVPKMATFKRDLERAGIKHSDGAGRVIDFHGLRVSYGTMLAKAGVAPRVAMELMRHTDMRLTMGIYTDPRILDTSKAVDTLPSLSGRPEDSREQTVALKTGTDDCPVSSADESIALNRDSQRPSLSISGQNGGSERAKTPIKTGVLDGGGGNRTRVP